MLLGGLGGPLEALRFIADHGFHGLELGSRLLTDEYMPVPILREVRLLAAANGIDLSVHAPTGWDPSTFDTEERAQYLSEMDALSRTMGQIGARVLVLHAGKVSGPDIESGAVPESTRLTAIESLTEFLHSCSSMAEDHGMVVCLENLPYMPGEYIAMAYGVATTSSRPMGS